VNFVILMVMPSFQGDSRAEEIGRIRNGSRTEIDSDSRGGVKFTLYNIPIQIQVVHRWHILFASLSSARVVVEAVSSAR